MKKKKKKKELSAYEKTTLKYTKLSLIISIIIGTITIMTNIIMIYLMTKGG